jgi:hypothetical protein
MHAVKQWLSYPDPWMYAVVIYVFTIGVVAGFALGRMPRKPRDLKAVEPPADMPPPPEQVPDHVPFEWQYSVH